MEFVAIALLCVYICLDSLNKKIFFHKLMKESQRKYLSSIQGLSFLVLSGQLRDMREINPDDPNLDDVANSANLIESLSVAYFEDWVDRMKVLEIYGDQVLTIIGQIYHTKDGVGKEILNAVPLAKKLYDQIRLHKGLDKVFN